MVECQFYQEASKPIPDTRISRSRSGARLASADLCWCEHPNAITSREIAFTLGQGQRLKCGVGIPLVERGNRREAWRTILEELGANTFPERLDIARKIRNAIYDYCIATLVAAEMPTAGKQRRWYRAVAASANKLAELLADAKGKDRTQDGGGAAKLSSGDEKRRARYERVLDRAREMKREKSNLSDREIATALTRQGFAPYEGLGVSALQKLFGGRLPSAKRLGVKRLG